ncbi:MAG: MMPL family transporter [Pseudomonadota bacterium]
MQIQKSIEKSSRLDRICWFLSLHRIKAFAVVLMITVVFIYGASLIKGEVILEHLFPYDHPYLTLHKKFAKIFGSGGSGVVIALHVTEGDIFNKNTLEKIKKITEKIELWDEIYRKLTISIASNSAKVAITRSKGEILIEPIMFPNVPKNEQEMQQLKEKVYNSPAYDGRLVSSDGTAAIIITEFKENISYERSFKLLYELVREHSDKNTSIHIVGYPMLMGWIYSLKPQTYMVFAISIAAVAFLLILIFRNFQGMFSPIASTAILSIWGLGFIGFTGINFNPMLYVLAFLIGARMIGNAHQIAYRYFEELDASGGDRFIACYETTRTMWIPNFAAVIADVAGFGALFIAKIVLMQQLAIIMSFWAATILLTGFLVPAICSIFPFKVNTSEWKKETCQLDLMARTMTKITKFAIGRRTSYVMGGSIFLLTIFCVSEMTKLKIGDPVSGSPVFYDDHPYNKDQAIINRLFEVSSENFALFYDGQEASVYEPIVLKTFEDFDKHMQKQLPDIYKCSNSIIDMGKMVNVTLREGDDLYYQLPRNETDLIGLFGYLRNTMGPSQISRHVDQKLQSAQINLFFSDHTSDNLLRIRDAAYGFFKDHPMKTEKGEFGLAGGRIGMEIGVNEEMKNSHLIIDIAVYCGIFFLCAICYRSFIAGLMLTIPLILANALCFSYMSIRNIGLSINTLPIAAIGAGLGVDFAIYLYSRCMEEFAKKNGDWSETIIQSVCTCGKAVVYTGLTVILPVLTWYLFSDMKFQAEVGFFLSMIMAANVILVLTLHPLLIWIIKPKFISRNMNGY